MISIGRGIKAKMVTVTLLPSIPCPSYGNRCSGLKPLVCTHSFFLAFSFLGHLKFKITPRKAKIASYGQEISQCAFFFYLLSTQRVKLHHTTPYIIPHHTTHYASPRHTIPDYTRLQLHRDPTRPASDMTKGLIPLPWPPRKPNRWRCCAALSNF